MAWRGCLIGAAVALASGVVAPAPAAVAASRAVPLSPENPPPFIRSWHAEGHAITSAANGDVYVVGSYDPVLRFDNAGTLVDSWDPRPSPGTDSCTEELDEGPNANLYLLDGCRDEVRVFTPDGRLVRAWPTGTQSTSGERPSAVEVADDGTVYVTDTGHDRIRVFSAEGTLLRSWGVSGSLAGQLDQPQSIAVTANGVFVGDRARVQRFSPSGVFLGAVGVQGTQPGQVGEWPQLAAGPAGDVFIADGRNRRVQKLDPSGHLLTYWGRDRRGTTTTDMIFSPGHLTVDGRGHVFLINDQPYNEVFEFGPGPRPDLAILGAPSGRERANDVYVAEPGPNQTSRSSAPRGESAWFDVSVQNDAPVADRIVVQGVASGDDFTVRYFSGSDDVTSEIEAGTFVTPLLAPSGRTEVRAEVSVAPDAPGDALSRVVLAARSEADATRVDAVALVTARQCRGRCVAAPTAWVLANPDAHGTRAWLYPVDLRLWRRGPAVRVGIDPNRLAVAPGGRSVYVSGGSSESLTAVEIATGLAGPPIHVPNGGVGVAITPDGRRAYVARWRYSGQGHVSVVDLVQRRTVSRLRVGRFPWKIVITPDGSTAFVTSSQDSTVTPIDVATNRVLPAISVPFASDAVVTPDGMWLYVTSDSDTVTPIRVSTLRAGPPIHVVRSPQVLAMTPDGATLLVAGFYDGTVVPVDLETRVVGTPIEVADNSIFDLQVTADGTTAYATVPYDGTVVEIDLTTRAVTRTLVVGERAYSIVLTPP